MTSARYMAAKFPASTTFVVEMILNTHLSCILVICAILYRKTNPRCYLKYSVKIRIN